MSATLNMWRKRFEVMSASGFWAGSRKILTTMFWGIACVLPIPVYFILEFLKILIFPCLFFGVLWYMHGTESLEERFDKSPLASVEFINSLKTEYQPDCVNNRVSRLIDETKAVTKDRIKDAVFNCPTATKSAIVQHNELLKKELGL